MKIIKNNEINDKDINIISSKYRLPIIPSDYNNWNNNRKMAWKMIPYNPHIYYYFFLAPGIKKMNYPPNEKQYKNALKNYPPRLNGWGLFSLHIPGYTGKECYEFYLYLIKEKKVRGRFVNLQTFEIDKIQSNYNKLYIYMYF